MATPRFRDDVEAVLHWLRAHRRSEDGERFLSALQRMRATLGRFPGIGGSVVERSGVSVRVLGLGRLPYLVWYAYESGDPATPVWLLVLKHEDQDRARFDPSPLDLT